MVRGQPNDEELAAVVSALLTLSRSRAVGARGDGAAVRRALWTRSWSWSPGGYRAPGSWQR
ncbi:acyl-CoA carboxylase subunit epsilon [Streptomyces alboniger]|uniref:acyl-CoA carboxylase subunit epsilon n=1 Tax=Streptomyces alboniger TaxID=132473 RepID=UPI0006E270A9|nr:acyl-CoA carboxylase subunit epsilon [Streptomyces alboniger]